MHRSRKMEPRRSASGAARRLLSSGSATPEDPMTMDKMGGLVLTTGAAEIEPVMQHILALRAYYRDAWEIRSILAEDGETDFEYPEIPKEPKAERRGLPDPRWMLTQETVRESVEHSVSAILRVRGFRSASYAAIKKLAAHAMGLMLQLCLNWKTQHETLVRHGVVRHDLSLELALTINKFDGGFQTILDYVNWLRSRQHKYIDKCSRIASGEPMKEDPKPAKPPSATSGSTTSGSTGTSGSCTGTTSSSGSGMEVAEHRWTSMSTMECLSETGQSSETDTGSTSSASSAGRRQKQAPPAQVRQSSSGTSTNPPGRLPVVSKSVENISRNLDIADGDNLTE